jgi:NADPH:quinone reductase-like Zn-dependent oxidoreductase
MPFSGLIIKDGNYKTTLFKDKDLSSIPRGYCVIKQKYFGITHSDLKIIDGTIAMEGCGFIEYISESSDRGFAVGDKVCYYLKTPLASYEKVIVHESGIMKINQGVSMEIACNARKFLTAHYLLHKMLSLKKGYWIIVTGSTGALGSIITAWANYCGLNVIAVVSSDDKKQYALQNGAKIAINYKNQNVAQEVNSATNGYGAFAIYDVIGKDFYKQAMQSISFFGHYILIGYGLSGTPEVSFNDMREKSANICFPSIDHYKHLAFENIIGGADFFEFASSANFLPKINSFPVSQFNLATQCLLNKNRVGLVICSFD